MLGFEITSWIRFFVFGFFAGVILSFVHFTPIAILGRIDAVAALLGFVLTVWYAKSFEPREWRRFVIRSRRWRNVFAAAVSPTATNVSIQRAHVNEPDRRLALR